MTMIIVDSFPSDFGGYTATEITLKLPDYPWDSAYTQSTSSAFQELEQGVDDLVSSPLFTGKRGKSDVARTSFSLPR